MACTFVRIRKDLGRIRRSHTRNVHSVHSLTISFSNEPHNESILRRGNAQRRREIPLHDPIVIVHEIGVVEEVVAQTRRIAHDSGNVTKEHGIQRGRST